ncbi:uncharacterized protein LOC120330484 [Styela clava]
MRPKSKEKKERVTSAKVEAPPQGEFVFPNNDRYKGEYKLNESRTIERDGVGTHTTSNGMRYTGQWSQDKMNGNGVLDLPSGAVYEGEFLNNQFHGVGTYTWPNGCVYKGSFSNNKLLGEGAFMDTEEQTWVGNFHYKAAPGLKFKLKL